MTQADGRTGYQESDGGSPLTGTAYVGERLTPPGADYSLAGYVAAGTYYSPTAYIDPFASGVSAAEKGAIIPVNALPSGQSTLTVWWFKKNQAKSGEFSDFYTPAKIGRYTLAYRDAAPAVFTENFNSGATGWTTATNETLSGSTVLGRFGKYTVGTSTNVITNSPVTAKTFAVGTVGGSGVEVAFRFYRLDTWESGEAFRVFIHGNVVINQPFTQTQITDTITGSRTVDGVNYNWSIVPVSSGFAQLMGGATTDQSFDVTLRATPTTNDAANDLSALTIGFGSNLNSAASDEAFAVDNLTIKLPSAEIVLASNQGTGSLSNEQATGTVYNQPNAAVVGYNPNEEHALLLGGNGSRAYALRDDLNIITGSATSTPAFSSLPRVLIQYTNATDGRPSMAVYSVQRENVIYSFSYGVTAGTLLTQISPQPLPLLPLPVKTDGSVANVEVDPGVPYHDSAPNGTAPSLYSSFNFKDRKGYDWVYRGPHNTSTPALGMQFYYTMRPDFVFPGRAQPATGTVLPYLRAVATTTPSVTYSGDAVTGTPLTILYRPVWPASPPTLATGETLALPKFGLPAVRGQTSARVLYQQSVALTGTTTPSATLHDPTRSKTVLLNASGVGLTTLPASLKTTMQNGKTYFQLAQPHLQQRFYFNPNLGNIGGLELIGEFVDAIAGEDYLNLNTLSPADVAALQGLVASNDNDKTKWDAGINALSTAVETFKEDPNKPGTYIPDSSKTINVNGTTLPKISSSETAVDSYALTSLGKGKGYVTLLFGDGEAFTPQGEPVSMAVIKVTDQLYQGDLKNIPASNPLDEQTTLRHSGDFAAHPENYEFEWRYSPAVEGTYPPVYSYTQTRVIGSVTTNQWKMLSNPPDDPSTDAPISYSAATTTLASSFSVNDASNVPGRPGKILLNTSNLTFTSALPTQVVFSANIDPTVGFVVYANNLPVLAYNLPVGTAVPGDLTPESARSGLVPSPEGLAYQFEISPASFIVGTNRIEVALYSSQGASSTSYPVDFQVHVPVRTDYVAASGSQWIAPTGTLTNTIVIGGSASSPLGNPLLVFGDNYFTMRYKAKDTANLVSGTTYSDWMQPVLVESWGKRVLDGINPFGQRQTDLYNNPISTDVSILTQAGKRWEGDVALNLTNINDFGLIEIYETVLNRVKSQSLDAGTTTDAVNSTLLLAAGYLSDLYMTLGNEAADDAQNPTIQINAGVTGDISSARFSFEGQEPSLIEETLALLRGRDDFLSPGTKTTPAYNRLYWNYTNGINSGEPIYATNYNIKEKAGSVNANGLLDAADAQYMFPQGHGDAYGHYLTALTGYYRLLTAPVFTWKPHTEGVSVLGQTVQVDYMDERKFAASAAALASTGVNILDFTIRSHHTDNESAGWSQEHDGKTNTATNVTRYWGSDEWASRVMQGAYFNWISANAMLPDVDSVHEGIQKIDRTTVPEISELVSSADRVTNLSGGVQANLNSLGLAKDAMTFDISPTELAAGKSHFEQVYDRAVRAALNAKNAFNQAGQMNQLQRQQNNSLDDYNDAVSRQEAAYQYQLITLYGTAYAGDIGPGKLYVQGYTGPDLYHAYFINKPSTLIDTSQDVTVTFREPINTDPFTEWSVDNAYDRVNTATQYTEKTFTFSKLSIAQFPAAGAGSRSQTGKIQSALLDTYEAQVNLREATNNFKVLKKRFDRDFQLYSELIAGYDNANSAANAAGANSTSQLQTAGKLLGAAAFSQESADFIMNYASGMEEAFPTNITDFTSGVRSGTLTFAAVLSYALKLEALGLQAAAATAFAKSLDFDSQAQAYLDDYNHDAVTKQQVVEFERLYDEMLQTAFAMNRRLSELQHATERVAQLYGEASHILSEREAFRFRAASIIQGYRTNDLVYRNLRNESLSQYKSLFDLAQTYTYCAAKAYDYETGLLGSSQGSAFINRVIGTYSLGDFNGNNPIETSTGDSGLASVLANLQDEWSVAKGRLGFNNPDRNGTVFSLRQELFRIRTDQPTTDDNTTWKQVLQQHVMNNVLNDPDVAIYCNNIAKTNGSSVPGIVIEFATTIEPGLNFFGWPLAPGDHTYSQSSFATKVYSSGLVFKGYIGMDPYNIGTPGAGGPASSNVNALSATPYAYLIPAGQDSMRAPPLGGANIIRSWAIKDQALPLPKNLGASSFSALQLFTPQGSLNEQLWITRKHQAFRAVDDPAYFYSSMPAEFTNSRLIGRSVWNSRWKIVIPAYYLLNNEQNGLDRFIQSVSDIKLFIRSYSNSGN